MSDDKLVATEEQCRLFGCDLIDLLRREGRYSGVWFGEHLLQAAAALDRLQSERASMEGEIERAREQLRLEMLEQPVTEGRDTYEDGFANGLAHAINRLAALTSSKTGDER